MADDHHRNHVRRFEAGLSECEQTILNLNVASHLSFAFVKNQFPFTLSSVVECEGKTLERSRLRPALWRPRRVGSRVAARCAYCPNLPVSVLSSRLGVC